MSAPRWYDARARTQDTSSLTAQPKDCRHEPLIDRSVWCKTCDTQQRREAAGLKADPNFTCSWKGLRAVRTGTRGTKRGPDGGVVPTPYAEEGVLAEFPFADIDAVFTVKNIAGVRRPKARFKDEWLLCTKALADAAQPIVDLEWAHATQTVKTPLYRAQDGLDGNQCGQCSAHFLGSWMCLRCGVELCLDCFEYLAADPAMGGGTLVLERDIGACRHIGSTTGYDPAQASFVTHSHADFIPIARIHPTRLGLNKLMLRMTAEQNAAPAQSHVAALGRWLEEDKWVGHVWGLRARMRADKREGLNSRQGILVLRAGAELSPSARQVRVARAVLSLDECFVVQQDALFPLNPRDLAKFLPSDTKVRMQAIVKDGPDDTPTTEEWTWAKLQKELSAKKRSARWIDVRDFPSDGDLRKLNPSATEAFRRAASFPGQQKQVEGLDDDTNRLQAMGDLGQWMARGALAGRDAREKVYIAFECDDEDGAEIPFSNNHLDGRPIGAEWLVWPPAARQHFNNAARACLLKGEVEPWTGDVLYGQNFMANAAFVDKVAELGGEECRAIMIHQREGEAVYIAAGWSHQVRDLGVCATGVKFTDDERPRHIGS
ncbi:hypothetical protein OC842_006979 [Tilletia horrida]|uniref:JmjC domain-containing protein n=1 Tax=Tilletia horrida TaxID=155126 RepID=A0AAN6G982_9BASI|nr:hypothetical protein OC842_006979 [Tilletia horrida]